MLPNELRRIKNKKRVHYNLSYEELSRYELMSPQVTMTNLQVFNVDTGIHTGRRPRDKYFVKHPLSEKDIAWGDINQPISKEVFDHLDDLILDHYSHKDIFILDGFVGVGKYRKSVRILTQFAWQHHFMKNMVINPTKEELKDFNPDFRLYNGCGITNKAFRKQGLNSEVFIAFNIEEGLGIIGGTLYTGEMKKALFSMMNYWLPKEGVLSMHCSANIASNGDTALFFGLSGTGKTTLSSDPHRQLIGDDEHGWDDEGVFNIEGGCYAKCLGLDANKEPLIYNAIRDGALLENVYLEGDKVDFSSDNKTPNTRVSYPIHNIDNYKEDLRGNHPKHIIFLSYDAFGILPPVSRLSVYQAAYYFLSGYTAKVAGTEQGVDEPVATFSACFGEAFLPMSPGVYAKLLVDKIKQHHTHVYLINTGFIGGAYGDGNGKRISLKQTRACLDSILNGDIEKVQFATLDTFNIEIPTSLQGIDDNILDPSQLWQDKALYQEKRELLAKQFIDNFDRYQSSDDFYGLKSYGPTLKP